MKADDLFDGITDIRDDLIDGAKEAPKKRKFWTKRRWLGAVAAVLAVAILGGILLRPGGGLSAYAIAQAKYPEETRRQALGDLSALRSFFAESARTFLTGEPGENRVYSPLNAYMALAMLAQLTDGESRGQILAALGSGGMDELRKQANDLWNSSYRDDRKAACILAGSVWLNQDVSFNQDTMNTLAADFYASSYRGEMGSKEFNKALQSWLNRQTGGLLKEQAGSVELDARTVLALAATVYFKASWADEFSKDRTETQTFHAPSGDVETDFMHQRSGAAYYWGENFATVAQPFRTGGAMWFLLPDEGVTPEELLADGEALDFLFTADRDQWEDQKYLYVNKSVPKFDVASKLDLKDGLQALGITDVFDPAAADFTPMTADAGPVYVSEVDHAARVVIDEEGCTAAAFTEIAAPGAGAPPDDEVDFVLDRPFLFCITDWNGLPLFVGVVNRPAGK